MSGRPCNPGSDLRELWQVLLGDIPFPQCGVPDQADGSHRRFTEPRTEPSIEPDQALAIRRESQRKGPPQAPTRLCGLRNLL
jgi:hypothetical protein